MTSRGGLHIVVGEKVAVETLGMGTPPGNYPGEFTPTVVRLIERELLLLGIGLGPYKKVLHLFSGSSTIGDVRVDLDHKNATVKGDVFEWLASPEANRVWSVIVLDPPYELSASKKKSIGYACPKPLATSVKNRRQFVAYADAHALWVIWLDACAPRPKGWSRSALYWLLPGGYRRPRVLSVLRTNKQWPS